MDDDACAVGSHKVRCLMNARFQTAIVVVLYVSIDLPAHNGRADLFPLSAARQYSLSLRSESECIRRLSTDARHAGRDGRRDRR